MKFNPEKHYLGTLCARGHNYKDEKSLRYLSNNQCYKCCICQKNERVKRNRLNGSRYIGTLCKHGHEHKNTGGSLRNVYGDCLVCHQLAKKRQRANPEYKKRENKAIFNYARNNITQMRDPYIRYLLKRMGFCATDITDELVNIKREHLSLKREIVIAKRGIKNGSDRTGNQRVATA